MHAVRARLVYVDGDAVEIRISAVHCGKKLSQDPYAVPVVAAAVTEQIGEGVRCLPEYPYITQASDFCFLGKG